MPTRGAQIKLTLDALDIEFQHLIELAKQIAVHVNVREKAIRQARRNAKRPRVRAGKKR